MSGECFTLDTNILVYSVDRLAGDRHAIAKRIVERAKLGNCVLTLQAASEFYAATTAKQKIPPADAAALAEDWLTAFPVAAAGQSAVRLALRMAASGRASYWDALLIATAAEAGCTAILTEDLADGATLFGVRIVHPFDSATLSATARRLLGA
jgi:predicted nucleic acid-binding protein